MFKSIIPVSLIDYPDKICTVLFTAGCNFNCPWCHNRDLIDPDIYKKIPDILLEDIKKILIERKNFIEGICITGGEPLLYGEKLREFLRMIRDTIKLPVKIDTNGYLPHELELCYDENLIDFTAMDIKNSFSKYSQTVGKEIDTSIIEQSINLIKKRSPNWQFRITKVPHLVDEDDIKWIENKFNVKLSVQQYRPV